jgi:transposase-like protein
MDDSLNICPRCEVKQVGKFNNGKIRPVCILCSYAIKKETKNLKAREYRLRQESND